MRAEVTVIVTQINGVDSFHFCTTELKGDDEWFPLLKLEGASIDDIVFKSVEEKMVSEGVAHNVVSVTLKHGFRNAANHFCRDYTVVYNEPLEDGVETVRVTRKYPTCCTSMYCGKGGDACNSCENKPALDEFEGWVKENGAVEEDPIWSPGYFTAVTKKTSE